MRRTIIRPKARRANPRERAKYSSSAVRSVRVGPGVSREEGCTNVMALELRAREA